ncbi:hypothetical protein IMZ48_45040 [Candidatus Bathyarchaeota archaeon]|nr:hypothetical protein [Candidatus Bathyarchaeota archaeon]
MEDGQRISSHSSSSSSIALLKSHFPNQSKLPPSYRAVGPLQTSLLPKQPVCKSRMGVGGVYFFEAHPTQ